MLVARQAVDGVLADLAAAAAAAAELAEAQAGTVMIGRTLLQQAVPVTFGLVAAGWLTAIDEASSWLRRVRADRLAVQFGGAAGTLAPLGEAGPEVVGLLADELGLARPVLPWHTDRLRIIELASALAGACAAVGKVARDVTLLAQSEVAEVTEGPGQDEPVRRGTARRVLGDAAQAESGGFGRHPWLHPARARAAGHPGRGRGAGTPAGRGRLAFGVGTARRPARGDRLRGALDRRTAARAAGRRRPDAGQPRRGGRLPDGGAGGGHAGPGARPGGGARGGGRGERGGRGRGPAAARRAARRHPG